MILDTSFQQSLVGYAFGRSFGSAVQRNRFRRRLRELVKTREQLLSPGIYVFGGSPRAASLGFEELGGQLDRLLAKCSGGSQ
jgi:ribonuclease P protein component